MFCVKGITCFSPQNHSTFLDDFYLFMKTMDLTERVFLLTSRPFPCYTYVNVILRDCLLILYCDIASFNLCSYLQLLLAALQCISIIGILYIYTYPKVWGKTSQQNKRLLLSIARITLEGEGKDWPETLLNVLPSFVCPAQPNIELLYLALN